jgi:hypothetical protein
MIILLSFKFLHFASIASTPESLKSENFIYIRFILLAEVAFIRWVKPLHYFFHFFFSWLFDIHFLGCESQYFLELIPLNATVIVYVNHVESGFVNAVEFVLVFDQLFPHQF